MIQLVSLLLITPMLRIDSFKIKIPVADCLLSFDEGKLNSRQEYDRQLGRFTKNDLSIANPALGLKSITYDLLRQEIFIEGSAKALGDQYYELININTVERLFGGINDTGCIRLNVPDAIAFSELLKVDTTQNLILPSSSLTYVNSLNEIRLNSKYQVDPFRKSSNTGIVFKGKQTSFKERQIFYDKSAEIRRDDKLIQAVGLNKLEAQFKGVLRVESNFTQLRKIKEYCGGRSNLLAVLQADAKPNYSLFKKIAGKTNSIPLFSEYEGYKLMEIEKLEGRKKIIADLNFDLDLINQFIDSRVGGNNSKYKRQYRELAQQLSGGKSIISINKHIQEIEDQLQVA